MRVNGLSWLGWLSDLRGRLKKKKEKKRSAVLVDEEIFCSYKAIFGKGGEGG